MALILLSDSLMVIDENPKLQIASMPNGSPHLHPKHRARILLFIRSIWLEMPGESLIVPGTFPSKPEFGLLG